MEQKQEIESFYYAKVALQKVTKYWYVFLISIVFFLGLAFALNWYSRPMYEVGSVILIDGNPDSRVADPSEEFMKSFAIFSPTSDINKEIQKMKSLEMIYKALEKTNAKIGYHAVISQVKNTELYHDSPFTVDMVENHLQPVGVPFEIKPESPAQFRLHVEDTKEVDLYNYLTKETRSMDVFSIDKIYNYGDTVKSNEFCFVVSVDPDKLKNFKEDTKFIFVFNNLDKLKYQYKNELKVEQLGKDILAIAVRMKVQHVQKGIDFINALTTTYMQRNVDKKNYLAEKSIEYINSQIGIIADSLTVNESDLQQFRSSNKLMEIKSLSDQTMKGANDLEDQKEKLEAKARYYAYVYNNLDNDQNNSSLLVPSSMGVDDQLLTGIVQQYLKFTTERNNLIQDKKTLSPYFANLNNKIQAQKKTLLETLQSQMTANNILLASINNQLGRENQRLRELPNTERKLVQIERKQNLHDDIYKYMLRKKAEAQIAKGSNLPDNDIIEPAKLTQPTPVSPNKMANYLGGLVLGFLFPFGIFGIKSLLTNTIRDEEILKLITDVPFIGVIHKRKNSTKNSVLVESPRSPIAESIRTVRTNIEYTLGDEKNKVILLTSSTSGEGKSFCSLNIAHSLALTKRKTVLLDFDLRKPTQYFPFETNNNQGITSFLRGSCMIDDIIVSTGIPNLDFVPVGDRSSDSSDMIDSDLTGILINKLKEKYEYVIIDTAPMGLVWETFLLMKYADIKIFVVRENKTSKSGFLKTITELQNKKVKNLCCLLNDASITTSMYKKHSQYFTNE
ncbi:MAG TPA: polysaccharide biosynthesis tyrosine autokinase [Bacteroidia bacterium]|nr:polysaccharide biosynthesis tyrosine autokinase [Bacteroidia bacterium]